MEYAPRRTRPAALQAGIAFAALLLILAAYIALLRLFIDDSRIESPADANRRDLIYVYVHCGILALAAIAGFFAGKWLSGLGLAFATLFLVVTIIGMTGVQMASYELACHGQNDLVRHWQC